MLVLVALLVANESGLILKTPVLAVEVLLLQTVMLGFLLALITAIDKALGVSYEANTAIAYISATKNQSVAAMIAVMALGPKAALVPALVPAIQAPVSISYLRVLPRLRKWLRRRSDVSSVSTSLRILFLRLSETNQVSTRLS